MGGLGMDGHVSCFWVQSHRQRRCCICCVYTDKTRQESNLIFHADTHHIQMCSKCRHIHIHTHAHTLPSGARVPHPPVLPHFTSSKDTENRWKGRRWREGKDICFFLALLSQDVNKSAEQQKNGDGSLGSPCPNRFSCRTEGKQWYSCKSPSCY